MGYHTWEIRLIVVQESSGLVFDRAKNSPSVFFLHGLYSTSKLGSRSLEYKSSKRPMPTYLLPIRDYWYYVFAYCSHRNQRRCISDSIILLPLKYTDQTGKRLDDK